MRRNDRPEPQRSEPEEQPDVVTRYDVDGHGKISLADDGGALNSCRVVLSRDGEDPATRRGWRLPALPAAV